VFIAHTNLIATDYGSSVTLRTVINYFHTFKYVLRRRMFKIKVVDLNVI